MPHEKLLLTSRAVLNRKHHQDIVQVVSLLAQEDHKDKCSRGWPGPWGESAR